MDLHRLFGSLRKCCLGKGGKESKNQGREEVNQFLLVVADWKIQTAQIASESQTVLPKDFRSGDAQRTNS